jgi:hypothetical protein
MCVSQTAMIHPAEFAFAHLISGLKPLLILLRFIELHHLSKQALFLTGKQVSVLLRHFTSKPLSWCRRPRSPAHLHYLQQDERLN